MQGSTTQPPIADTATADHYVLVAIPPALPWVVLAAAGAYLVWRVVRRRRG